MYSTTYHRPSSVDEAAALFAKGSDAKYLAGGHTLLPVMKQRLASPSNPLGLKGCGEAGAIGSPPAVINAITDAIGSEAIAMPATAQAVWAAMQKANASRQAAE
jgi:hypothetical protein